MRTLLGILCTLIFGQLWTEENPQLSDESETTQTTLSHGLALRLPTNWEYSPGISPRISVWRAPISNDQKNTPSTSPTIALVHNTGTSSTKERINQLSAVILDLYNEPSIIASDNNSANKLGHPHLEYTFRLGPTEWRQLLIFLPHPNGEKQQTLTLTFSSPQQGWETWETERGEFLRGLVKN
jgi:hypothetical protein